MRHQISTEFKQSNVFGPQIWRASDIDPARLNTSNGAFPVRVFTVRGHESLIQKWENAIVPENQDALTAIRTRNERSHLHESEASKPTVVLVNEPLPRLLWEHTMGDIRTHLCCTLGCQDFLTMKRERTMSEPSMISQKLKASTV